MKRPDVARVRRGMLLGAAGLAALSVWSPAAAQEAPDGQEVGEVLVTGSRVIRDGTQAPTPVTVVQAQELENSAPRNIVEGLTSLPAFRGSTSTNTPALATASNNVGSFLNLRGLGAQRTLVLLDGRRVAPAANNGATNFNLLPQSLISRVDVVTGGASAAYGSDAVAGVVNVVTQQDYVGVKGLIQGGVSQYNDVGSRKAYVTAGQKFMDDRLHLVGSVFYNDTDPVLNALQSRDWAGAGNGRLIIGTGATQYSDIFQNVNQNNYRGGVILLGTANNGPANMVAAFPTGVKFLEGGVVSPYNPGTFVTANNAVGGDGSRNTTSLAGGLVQYNVFGRATYEVNDSLKIYGQVMASRAKNVYQPSTNQTVTATQVTIFEGNPFIPASIASLLAASAPTTTTGTACGRAAGTPTVALRCFKLSRIYQEDVDGRDRITSAAKNDAIDLVVGFDADVFGDYRLTGYYEHGDNDFRTATSNNAKWENLFAAIDAVRDASGKIVCRTDITNPGLYPGCVPYNPFGFGSPSQEARNYAFVTSTFRTHIKQDVAALDLAGDLFELPAGPLGVAVGAEYRRFTVDQTSDPGNSAVKTGTGIRGFPASLVGLPGLYNFGNVSPFSGKVVVKEAYVELNAPLIKDQPLIHSLELNAAGRYTHYSTSGGVTTYKIGAVYSPIQDLRLRGTYSRDIRAPSPIELFQGNGQGAQTIIDPFNGDRTFNILGSTRGNPNLDPEEADTYALGLVYQPSFLPGFAASIDYYNITLKGAIGTLTTQLTLNQCFEGNQVRCASIIRDPTGVIISVLQPYLNLQELKTSGIDAEFVYRVDPEFVPGSLTARVLIGYLHEHLTKAPGSAPVDSQGQVGSGVSNPRYRGQASVTWDNGPLSLNVEANFIGAGYQNKQLAEAQFGANTIRNNHVPSVTVFDVGARYRFGPEDRYESFVTINNLFNKDPPVAPGTNSANFIQTNYELYETIGRYYTAGIRFKF